MISNDGQTANIIYTKDGTAYNLSMQAPDGYSVQLLPNGAQSVSPTGSSAVASYDSYVQAEYGKQAPPTSNESLTSESNPYSGFGYVGQATGLDADQISFQNQVNSYHDPYLTALEIGTLGPAALVFAPEGLLLGGAAEAGGTPLVLEQGFSTSISASGAQSALINAGIEPELAAGYVDSFEGDISLTPVNSGANFLRYTDLANSSGRFLTTTAFGSPAEAVNSLAVQGFNNGATLVQGVTATEDTVALQGTIKGSTTAAQQSLAINPNALDSVSGGHIERQ